MDPMKDAIKELYQYVEQIIAKNPMPFELKISMIHDSEGRTYYIYKCHFILDNCGNYLVTHSPEKMLKILQVYFGN